jgi:hypothetical protein
MLRVGIEHEHAVSGEARVLQGRVRAATRARLGPLPPRSPSRRSRLLSRGAIPRPSDACFSPWSSGAVCLAASGSLPR